jgi:hypothetical protein
MLNTLVRSNSQWDETVPWIIFAARDCVQESLGYSPFQLVFGHTVRGPLKLIHERWTGTRNHPVENFDDFHVRLKAVWELAHKNLGKAQVVMKGLYDKNSRKRTFNPGEKVLVLVPNLNNACFIFKVLWTLHGSFKIE